MDKRLDVTKLKPDQIDLSEIDLDQLSDVELDVLERKIASKYMHIFPTGVVVWAFANLAVWLALWPLTFLGIVPWWLALIIASLNVSWAYLPSHDAQHSIIAREGRPLRWLNELVGHLSLIPMAAPFRVMRHTHFEHHNHSNNPELDPDYGVHAESDWAFLKKSILGRQPKGSKSNDAYPNALKRVGKEHLLMDAVAYNFVFYAVLFGCAWAGYAIEAAVLWWLPKHIASTYIQYYLSWAPHHPGKKQGRYQDTRAFKSRLGSFVSMCMEYHIIHHLYPRIPLLQTPDAYYELRPILLKKGCDLGGH